MRALILAVLLMFSGGCVGTNPDTGEELRAIPVGLFAETVEGILGDIVLANPDGILTWEDWPSTSFILINRVVTAWQKWDAEQRAIESSGVDR